MVILINKVNDMEKIWKNIQQTMERDRGYKIDEGKILFDIHTA